MSLPKSIEVTPDEERPQSEGSFESASLAGSVLVHDENESDLEMKRKELDELNERLATRVGQIERAELRLLELQNQLLGLPSLAERFGVGKEKDTESVHGEVFRVEVSTEEPLRMAPASPRSAFLSMSSSSVTPTAPRPLASSDLSVGLNASSSTAGTSPKSAGLLSASYSSSSGLAAQSFSPLPSPSLAMRSKGSTFNIRTSSHVSSSEGERSSFGSPSGASTASGSTSISFTLLKSLFGSSNSEEKSAVHFKIESSQVQICEKVPKLSSGEIEVFRANVGGWGCNVKYVTLGRTEANDARFFKRIKLLEALPTHANIARYYFHDIAEDGHCCRIFTEWFHTNLAEVIERRAKSSRAFSAREIEFVLMEVVKGTEFLHSYSILHRTISPSNIHVLLNEEGDIIRVAIANLDMAKVITDKVNAKSSSTTLDPRYTAPEVITAKRTGNAYTFPSDIWSLGLVAFSLLSLKKPWCEHNDFDFHQLTSLITSGSNGPSLQLPEFLDPNTTEEYAPFVEIFQECTRFKPDDRPTVSIIKQALITKASIAEHRRASQLNIGFTYQPKREGSTFFENFLVIGCPIGLRKPEQGQPTILFQYPLSCEVTHPDVLVKFCMAQQRTSSRVKRTASMSNVNQKLFASRDMTEHSGSASIFTMMEGEELRFGVCVFFEEPVDIVPSFVSMNKVLEEAKKDPTAVDIKRISKSTTSLAMPPASLSKPKKSTTAQASSTTHATHVKAPQAAFMPLPILNPSECPPVQSSEPVVKRRRHTRTASDGSALRIVNEAAAAAAITPSSSPAPAPLPISLGHVKFTHRCYMLFSKWPFFKLHFEVLWSIIAQERLARISLEKPAASSHPTAPFSSANASLSAPIAKPLANSNPEAMTRVKPKPVLALPPLGSSPLDSDSSMSGDSTPELLKESEQDKAKEELKTLESTPAMRVSPSSKLSSLLEEDAVKRQLNEDQQEEPAARAKSLEDSSPLSSSISSTPTKSQTLSDMTKDLVPTAATITPPTVTAETSAAVEGASASPAVSNPAAASATSTTTIVTTKKKSATPKRSGPEAVFDATIPLSPTRPRHHVLASKSGSSDSRPSTPSAISEPEPTEENCMVLKMLSTYHRVSVPVEKHQTTLTLANNPPILYTPGDVTESVAEWCFPCMFRMLSVKTLIKLLTAVLLEDKIVMFCNDTGILTSCVTGLTAMLRPYAWQGTFLPIVPPSMMAVLESPIPFVAGITDYTHTLDNFDGVVVDLTNDVVSGHTHFARLPVSDRLYDAFSAYASAIQNTRYPSNPCKSSVADTEALTKLLAALALWHTSLLEQLAAVPSVGLDFKWGNNKDVEAVIRALSSSERDFYREFVETQHFSIVSERLNTVICQLRSRKDHQKHVQKLENIFTSKQ